MRTSRLPWLITALVLAAALAWLHTTALGNYWYWYFPWLDVPVHFLAGITMGTAVIGVLGKKFQPQVFLTVIIIGSIGWEVFELFVNIEREANFVLDTSLDLLMDAVGATFAYGIARLTLWRST